MDSFWAYFSNTKNNNQQKHVNDNQQKHVNNNFDKNNNEIKKQNNLLDDMLFFDKCYQVNTEYYECMKKKNNFEKCNNLYNKMLICHMLD